MPGQVIRYERSFFLRDRFELPGGTTVGLWHFVGFKLRLAPSVTLPPPTEDIIVEQARGEPVRPAPALGVSSPR